LGVGGWGVGSWASRPNPQPPIPNPQSPIPNPQSKILNPIFFKNKILIILEFNNFYLKIF